MSGHWCPIHKTAFFKKGNMKSYAHPIKDAGGNTTGWCNEDDLSKAEPKAEPHEDKPFVPAINPEKQASIEAQNARTNLTSLMIAGKLTTASIDAYDPLEFALVSQLTDRAGVTFKGFKNKQGTMVDAAKAAGATDADRDAARKVAKGITTLGKLRTEVLKFGEGYETQAEQEKVFEQAFDAISDFPGTYMVAWEKRHG